MLQLEALVILPATKNVETTVNWVFLDEVDHFILELSQFSLTVAAIIHELNDELVILIHKYQTIILFCPFYLKLLGWLSKEIDGKWKFMLLY